MWMVWLSPQEEQTSAYHSAYGRVDLSTISRPDASQTGQATGAAAASRQAAIRCRASFSLSDGSGLILIYSKDLVQPVPSPRWGEG